MIHFLIRSDHRLNRFHRNAPLARTGPYSNLFAIKDKLLYTFKEKVSSKVIVRFWKRCLNKAKEYRDLCDDVLLAKSDYEDSEIEEIND
ncbi:hypothetical protein RclHR1_29740001 [Rhizophagus clarus]|uniref:Uncharacterized protein n=1 Tax=Rhizophagus clarus TaxID=94130 RepID=A0A2Z6RJB1_9GLOM|nr:hypothetical protein RclHR1_29740001 [Rhizophagus clarus]GES99434.1 hypothetical protein RCL_e13239_RclHR1_29740001 [Rhizophagus clarus]